MIYDEKHLICPWCFCKFSSNGVLFQTQGEKLIRDPVNETYWDAIAPSTVLSPGKVEHPPLRFVGRDYKDAVFVTARDASCRCSTRILIGIRTSNNDTGGLRIRCCPKCHNVLPLDYGLHTTRIIALLTDCNQQVKQCVTAICSSSAGSKNIRYKRLVTLCDASAEENLPEILEIRRREKGKISVTYVCHLPFSTEPQFQKERGSEPNKLLNKIREDFVRHADAFIVLYDMLSVPDRTTTLDDDNSVPDSSPAAKLLMETERWNHTIFHIIWAQVKEQEERPLALLVLFRDMIPQYMDLEKFLQANDPDFVVNLKRLFSNLTLIKAKSDQLDHIVRWIHENT